MGILPDLVVLLAWYFHRHVMCGVGLWDSSGQRTNPSKHGGEHGVGVLQHPSAFVHNLHRVFTDAEGQASNTRVESHDQLEDATSALYDAPKGKQQNLDRHLGKLGIQIDEDGAMGHSRLDLFKPSELTSDDGDDHHDGDAGGAIDLDGAVERLRPADGYNDDEEDVSAGYADDYADDLDFDDDQDDDEKFMIDQFEDDDLGEFHFPDDDVHGYDHHASHDDYYSDTDSDGDYSYSGKTCFEASMEESSRAIVVAQAVVVATLVRVLACALFGMCFSWLFTGTDFNPDSSSLTSGASRFYVQAAFLGFGFAWR
jgi:hypothetical protein